MHGSFGHVQRSEQRLEQLGHRRLAQPAQSERRERDAQLACGQVSVDVVGDELGVLGALSALVDEDFYLRLAHTHERELGGDKERIHEQEKQNKQQTECYRHDCGWSSFI